MARNNETVAEIKYRIYQQWRGCENCSLAEMDGADLIAIADQFEAAHKRDLAAKDSERLTIVANYERVIAAKDAEIARLRAALKPVLECDCWIFETDKSCATDGAADAIKAVLEAQRIYKEEALEGANGEKDNP